MHDLVPIVLFTGLFAMIFGVAYLRSRENMAMLEKGFNPRSENKAALQPYISLKIGLLLTGAGLGLFTAHMLDTVMFNPGMNSDALYPALIGVGGGLGLIISYFIEKKQLDKQGHK